MLGLLIRWSTVRFRHAPYFKWKARDTFDVSVRRNEYATLAETLEIAGNRISRLELHMKLKIARLRVVCAFLRSGLRPLANQGAPSGAAVVVLEPAAILGNETLYNGVREAHFTA